MCVACREMRAKREMVRVVRTPSGEVRIDPTGKAAGRGAYVDPREPCVTVALRERRLEQALEVEAPPTLEEDLRAMLVRPVVPPAPKVIRLPAGKMPRRS